MLEPQSDPDAFRAFSGDEASAEVAVLVFHADAWAEELVVESVEQASRPGRKDGGWGQKRRFPHQAGDLT